MFASVARVLLLLLCVVGGRATPVFAQAAPESAHGAAPAAPAAAAVAPLAPAPGAKTGSEVKLHDTPVFTVWVGHGGASAQQRASAASAALEHALDAQHAPVRVVRQPLARVIFAADVPIIELFAEDAAAVGDASLDVHAARISARARKVLREEKQRRTVAEAVGSASLVVFFGLLAFFAVRKLSQLLQRARDFLQAHPERVVAIRLQSIEVLGAGSLRGLLMAALGVARWALLGGAVYLWLVFSLSLFEATRPYTERLTSIVITPLTELAGRVLSALPMGFLALVWGGVVLLLVRFADLLFASIARGETRVTWLPSDLVLPAGLLLRIAIVVLGLVLAGPIVTGDAQGALARAGSTVMMALALASAPVLASAAVGVVQVFARRMRVGQELSFGERRGRVLSVGFLDVRLRQADGGELRVPHLLALWQPLSVPAAAHQAEVFVEVCVAAGQSVPRVHELLLMAAAKHGEHLSVQLEHFDVEGSVFRVRVPHATAATQSELRAALCEALQAAGIPLGRMSRGQPS